MMKKDTVDWAREWTVEASQISLHAKLFPTSGPSTFKLEKLTQTTYKLHPLAGMKRIWNEAGSFKEDGTHDLMHRDPRLPKHPGGTHKPDKYFKAVEKLEHDMDGQTKRLTSSLTVDGVPHTVTLLQAMGQLEGDEGKDEPMLIVKVHRDAPGPGNPDGSAVGHF